MVDKMKELEDLVQMKLAEPVDFWIGDSDDDDDGTSGADVDERASGAEPESAANQALRLRERANIQQRLTKEAQDEVRDTLTVCCELCLHRLYDCLLREVFARPV